MKQEDKIAISLDYVLGAGRVIDVIEKKIEVFFEKYKIAEWLSMSQARMINEILNLGDREKILERLLKYKERQSKRESQAEKWQGKPDGKMAIDAFYEIVEGIGEDEELKRAIKKGLEELNVEMPDLEQNYIPLIEKFNYLFITKFIINTKEGRNV